MLVKFITSLLEARLQPETTQQSSDSLVLTVLNSEVEALHYSPLDAHVRFTVSNISKETLKINDLRLAVTQREKVKLFRLPTPGAPYSEFDLKADISETDSVDLLAKAHAQFILKAGDSDAFSVTVRGREGFRYQVLVECFAESLIEQGRAFVSSAQVALTYPTRTLEGLRNGA